MRWIKSRAFCVFLAFLLTNLTKTQPQRKVLYGPNTARNVAQQTLFNSP